MRLFLDTEFNGFGGELISVALMPEDGPSFYEVCTLPVRLDPWVREHVVPLLGKESMSYDALRLNFHFYIREYIDPEVICDWHADAGHFCDLLAGNDYGSSLDFACRLRIVKTPNGVPVSSMPHNALADAEALKNWYLNGHRT